MTLPVSIPNIPDWQLCRVRWTIRDSTGAPAVVTQVGFTSSVPYVISARSEVTIAAVFPDARFVDGRLTSLSGDPWIDLVASEDPDINPRNWTITADARLAAGRSITATFTTPVNGDINLSSVVQVVASSGQAVVRGPQGTSVSGITASGTTATVSYSDGTTSAFTLPVGTGGGAATTDAGLLTSGTLADARLTTATTSALAKAGTAVQPAGLTKAAVGLANVDNTSDTAKPVSTAQAAALAAKADTSALTTKASTTDPRLSDTRTPTDASVTTAKVADGAVSLVKLAAGVQASLGKADAAVRTVNGAAPDGAGNVAVATGGTGSPPTTDASALTSGTLADARLSSATTVNLTKAATAVQPSGLTKSAVGLGNVDNTSDTAKPVSAVQAAALATKADLTAGKIPTSQIPAASTHEVFPVANRAAMLALTTTQVQPGDEAIIGSTGAVADRGRWFLAAANPSVIASWSQVPNTSGVSSINGQAGPDVVLGFLDVGAASTTDARLADQRTPTDASVTNAKLDAPTKALVAKAGTSVQLVNGTSPDANGNVAVATGGTGSPPTTDASALTSGVLADARLSTAVAASLSKAGTAVQPAGLTKTAVGLSNVDNTADTTKPVSSAQAAALAAKADASALTTETNRATTAEQANATAIAARYTKPSGGIPNSDLATPGGAGSPPTTDASALTTGTLADARLSTATAAALSKAGTAVQTVSGVNPDGTGGVNLFGVFAGADETVISVAARPGVAGANPTVDDTAAFNAAAVAAALASRRGRGILLVPYRSTPWKLTGLAIPAGVTLWVDDRATIEKVGASTGAFLNLASGSRVDGSGTLDAAGLAFAYLAYINANAVGAEVRNVRFLDTGGTDYMRGVETGTGVVDALIEGVKFDGVSCPIFANKGPTNLRVRRNTMQRWRDRAVYVLGDASLSTTDLEISGNLITDMAANALGPRQPIQINGVDGTWHRRLVIDGNRMYGPGTSYTDTVNPGPADLISLHQCEDFRVTNNHAIDGGDVGITISQQSHRGVVGGNICRGNDTTGLCLGSSSSTYTRDVAVTGNTFMNNGQNRKGDRGAPNNRAGMWCYNAANIALAGNTWGDDQSTKTQQYGANLQSSTNINLGANVDAGNVLGEYFAAYTTVGGPAAIAPRRAVKAANTVVNNSAVLIPDPHLVVNLDANSSYTLDGLLIYAAQAAADLNLQLVIAAAGASVLWSRGALDPATTASTSATSRARLVGSSVAAVGGVGASVAVTADLAGYATTQGNGGTLTLSWSQAVADASDATMFAGSWIRATKG